MWDHKRGFMNVINPRRTYCLSNSLGYGGTERLLQQYGCFCHLIPYESLPVVVPKGMCFCDLLGPG